MNNLFNNKSVISLSFFVTLIFGYIWTNEFIYFGEEIYLANTSKQFEAYYNLYYENIEPIAPWMIGAVFPYGFLQFLLDNIFDFNILLKYKILIFARLYILTFSILYLFKILKLGIIISVASFLVLLSSVDYYLLINYSAKFNSILLFIYLPIISIITKNNYKFAVALALLTCGITTNMPSLVAIFLCINLVWYILSLNIIRYQILVINYRKFIYIQLIIILLYFCFALIPYLNSLEKIINATQNTYIIHDLNPLRIIAGAGSWWEQVNVPYSYLNHNELFLSNSSLFIRYLLAFYLMALLYKKYMFLKVETLTLVTLFSIIAIPVIVSQVAPNLIIVKFFREPWAKFAHLYYFYFVILLSLQVNNGGKYIKISYIAASVYLSLPLFYHDYFSDSSNLHMIRNEIVMSYLNDANDAHANKIKYNQRLSDVIDLVAKKDKIYDCDSVVRNYHPLFNGSYNKCIVNSD